MCIEIFFYPFFLARIVIMASTSTISYIYIVCVLDVQGIDTISDCVAGTRIQDKMIHSNNNKNNNIMFYLMKFGC